MSEAFKCAVSADLFRRAWAGVSTEGTRYYLNGVHVEPDPEGGAILTATNGHWLISIRDPRGICEGSGIVRLNKVMLAALKPHRSDCVSRYGVHAERVLVVGPAGDADHPMDGVAQVVLSGKAHTPKGSDFEVEPRPEALEALGDLSRAVLASEAGEILIRGEFPSWRRVVPANQGGSVAHFGVDTTYFSKASAALGDGKSGKVEVAFGGDANSPILLTMQAHQFGWSGFAVVMPTRTEALRMPTIPTWARQPEERAAA